MVNAPPGLLQGAGGPARGQAEDEMELFWFLVGSLAVWRVTHLLAAEDGPWQLIVRLRGWLGASVLGALLDCFYCLSVWVASPFAFVLGATWPERLLLWPALSGAAILLERASARPGPTVVFDD